MKRYLLIMVLALAGALIPVACGGSQAATSEVDTGGDTGAGGAPEEAETTSEPLLDQSGLAGQTYQGPVLPPQSGYGTMRIYDDNTLDILVIIEGEPAQSFWLNGEVTNQRIAAAAEYGQARMSGVLGRSGLGFDLNLTIPGVGFVRIPAEPVDDGDLFEGELNGYTAGLMLVGDGTVLGIAAVEGGDEPVFEFLCVEGEVVQGGQVTATTCDSGTEVTLASATQ